MLQASPACPTATRSRTAGCTPTCSGKAKRPPRALVALYCTCTASPSLFNGTPSLASPSLSKEARAQARVLCLAPRQARSLHALHTACARAWCTLHGGRNGVGERGGCEASLQCYAMRARPCLVLSCLVVLAARPRRPRWRRCTRVSGAARVGRSECVCGEANYQEKTCVSRSSRTEGYNIINWCPLRVPSSLKLHAAKKCVLFSKTR